ncbi:MAG TPA: redoxin domain-containing protein [Chryseolinea sp.]|nr:redoxin domain-containing protein [Chryseolinea sp.]
MLKILICTQLLGSFCVGILRDKAHETTNHEPLRAYVFLGTDCPISQDYVGLLNEMDNQYEGEVDFMGVIPQPIDARDVNGFRKEYQVKFDLIADKTLELTEKYGVHITPEVVLMDESNVVQYQGAIDNWYYALGKHQRTATEHYLRDAIEALLLGRAIEVKRTEAVGCIISMPAHHH